MPLRSASFLSLTQGAIFLVAKSRKTWFFLFPLGILLWVSSSHPIAWPENIFSSEFSFTNWLTEGEGKNFFRALTLILLTSLGHLFLRGPLLLFFEEKVLLLEKKERLHLKLTDFIQASKTTFFFEISYWLVITLLVGILFLPAFIAWKVNQTAFPAIAEIAVILSLSFALYLFLLKEFAYFFSLLTKVSLRSSIDLGTKLLRRHTFITILFSFYTTLIALLFTFFIDSVMLSFAEPLPEAKPFFFTTLLSVLFLGTYALFDQALRLLFFRSIASTRPKRSSPVKVLESVEKASETPTL